MAPAAAGPRSRSNTESSLYYTFSTIAQALAVAVGLLAAFVSYRLQSINAEIQERITRTIQYYGGETRVRLDEFHVNGNYEGIAEIRQEQLAPELELGAVGFSRKRFRILAGTSSSLRDAFKRSLLLTVLLIAFALMAVVATPYISGWPCSPRRFC